MSRHVLAFNDFKEVLVERTAAGEVLIHARIDDPAINAVGIRTFARPALPGARDVTLANVPVALIRAFSKAHGGVEPTWTEDAAIEILRAAAADPSRPDAEVAPREAATFPGSDASVPAPRVVHDAPAVRALEADLVTRLYEDAHARFLAEVGRKVEPPTDPAYAAHWTPARGWRVKVSALRGIAEAIAPALEPEHAKHPLQVKIQALRRGIAELSLMWRGDALKAEADARRTA